MAAIGHRVWAIPEGYIPATSLANSHEFVSHEAACLLNTSTSEADVRITLYFADRSPVGPYRITVPPQRTLHLRFNDLTDPEPVPLGTDYASVIESSVPIVVQFTRLDSRSPAIALLSTMAFPSG